MLRTGGCCEEQKDKGLSTPLDPGVEKALCDLEDLHIRKVVNDEEYEALRAEALKGE